MDMAGKDSNVEPTKGNDEPVIYNIPPNIPSDWNVNRNNVTKTSIETISMVESSSCSSAPMIDSFCFPNYDQPISGHNLGYCDMNIQNNASNSNTFDPIKTFQPNIPGIFAQNLPHFPDSAFIERAARFSCFGGEMMSLFSNQGPNEALGCNGSKRNEMDVPKEGSLARAHEIERGPHKDEKRSESFVNSHDEAKNGVEMSDNQSAEEGSFGKRVGCKKRKRTKHTENNDTVGDKQKGEQSPSSSSKPGGKNGKQGSERVDPPKEDYIHIRARRGQATNSHSLAERVRREKISERMKFLQDLVPGCNKVTGKAVMLDEIINYVQSLQRQVEFLSMKLSTVNARTDFNIEGFLSKDILQPRIGLPFPPDMTMPFSPLHLSQPGPIQAGLSSVNNDSKALRRPMILQSTTSQVPNVWEDELNNIVHMGFNTSAPKTAQDLNGI